MKRVRAPLALWLVLGLLGCGAGPSQPAAEPAAPASDGDTAPVPVDDDEAAAMPDPLADPGPGGPGNAPTDTAPAPRQAAASAGECQNSSAKLAIAVDRQSIDLEKGVLEATMDGPICQISMTIVRADGQPKVELSFPYTQARRQLAWEPLARDQIEKIEVRVTAANGAYQGVVMVPWSVTIDHEDVVFDTDQAVIKKSEVSHLEDSLVKIKQVLQKVEGKGFGPVTLFIAGHTDTVGSPARNLDLSRRRAQAIAGWFMKRGLCVPIAYDGFGEIILKKMTGDEVDAQENRRADYILSIEPPPVGKGAAPAWKYISKGC